MTKAQYRTRFISDIHLGMRGCQADLLFDVLRRIDVELRNRLNLLSNWAKRQVKQVISFNGENEKVQVRVGPRGGNILCQFHSARIAVLDDILYLNGGDWAACCIAVVEASNSQLKSIHRIEDPARKMAGKTG